MSPGQAGFVPGTKWVCPRDKPRFSPYFTQRKPSSSLGQTQFVPGTFRGRRAAERVYVLKVYVPLSSLDIRRFTRACLDFTASPVGLGLEMGEALSLTVGACLLTAELLCLQSLQVLIRLTFPQQAKSFNCKSKSSNYKHKAPKRNCK